MSVYREVLEKDLNDMCCAASHLMRHSVQCDYDCDCDISSSIHKTGGTCFSDKFKKFPGPGRPKYQNRKEQTCYKVEVTSQQQV